LVPIVLSLIGGIIGYLVVRKKDRQLANRLLIVGIVIFVIAIIVEGLLYSLTLYSTP
jgi:cytochrome bd-type quinol oxidase subunit 1